MVRKNCVRKKVMLNEALPRARLPLRFFARNSPPPRSSAWFSFSPWDIVIWQTNMQRSRSAEIGAEAEAGRGQKAQERQGGEN